MNRATNPDRSGASPGRGGIPRGIEVLVKKASVDDAFRALLLEKRAEAAAEIGLELDPAEAAMLNGIPAEQLEAIIARTRVRPAQRKVFLGRTATVMLAALGVMVASGCDEPGDYTAGERPDRPEDHRSASEVAPRPTSQGIRPHDPRPAREASEERPAAPWPGPSDGIRPDGPPARADDDTSDGEEE